MLIDNIRTSRKNPSVLKAQIITVRSSRPSANIFVFEGPEDIGVYETWIAKTSPKLQYEPVTGRGKEQLEKLHELLHSCSDKLLAGVYFFVDCDFDEYREASQHLFTLDGYSIENFLCCEIVLESLLTDEFRCAGDPKSRQNIINTYSKILDDFFSEIKELNFLLYCARQLDIEIIKKPESISDLLTIRLDSIAPTKASLSDELQLKRALTTEEMEERRPLFECLDKKRSHRGKYVIDFFRKWLKALEIDKRSSAPIFFERTEKLSGDPSNSSLRRFSSASVIPDGLDTFLSGVS